MIKYSPALSLVIFSILIVMLSACSKTNTSAVLQAVDTVKYEAILNKYSGDWCVNSTLPGSYKSMNGQSPVIPPDSDGNYRFGECGETENQEFEFTISKYVNRSITFKMAAYNQWPAVPPYPDTAITLNIYINNKIVATNTSITKDSVQYTIH